MKIDKHVKFLFTFTKGGEQMSSSTKSQGEVKRWHVISFVTIAGLLTLLVLFASVRDLLLLPGQSGFPSVIHRWHEAQSGAFMTILFGGSLLTLLWKPQTKPLLMQYLVLSIGIVCICFATATGAGFTPIVLVVGVVLIGILVAAYPRPRDLLNIRREPSLSYPLLAITVVAAICACVKLSLAHFGCIGSPSHTWWFIGSYQATRLASISFHCRHYVPLSRRYGALAARLCRKLGNNRWCARTAWRPRLY